VKLFAKQQEAMQVRFHQSFTIKGTQNFHYINPIRPASNERNKFRYHFLVVQTSTNYEPKPLCLKGNYVAAGALA